MSCTTGVMYIWISTILKLSVNSLQLGILRIRTALPGKEGSRWGYQTSRLRNDGPTGVAKVRFVTNYPPSLLTVLHITVLSDRKVLSQLKIPCFLQKLLRLR